MGQIRGANSAVYQDETHCLVGPEIRSAADNPISCYCRDALADAQYVYRTYLINGKDRNLNSTYLTLTGNAQHECGKDFSEVSTLVSQDQLRWNGPEVQRTYPSDAIIDQIPPDSRGFRRVTYAVRLTFRDEKGQVIRVDAFNATEILPAGYKSAGCPPSAVCPK